MYIMRNPCPLMLLLTLTPSRLCHMTSRSCAYLLSLFHCRLIIITTIYTCPNPNPSPSLFISLRYNIFVDELHRHFGLLDPIGKVANMLDNLRMKPSDKISTYNVDFMCYTSQLGWENSVLYHCYYQGLPNQIHDPISTWE